MASSIVLSWYHHQPGSHQQSFKKVLDVQRPRPIDRIPGTPGSGKKKLLLLLDLLSIVIGSGSVYVGSRSIVAGPVVVGSGIAVIGSVGVGFVVIPDLN